MRRIKSIHFVGIKGVGMTPLAIIAKEAGFNVSGSDIEDKFITDEVLSKAGIVPDVGFSEKNIGNVDLVITTGAHGGFNNIEVKEAKKQGIKVLTQGKAVGEFMEGKIFGRRFKGISVAGTHGKTTTTAMIATILKESGLDPSYVVGTGFVSSLGLPGHYGKGQYFVAEADEYATEPKFDRTPKFLWQKPKILIITSIEFDHPDIYSSIDEVRNAFLKLANQLPKDGILIVCGDSQEVQRVLRDYKGRRITYGFSKENDYVVSNVQCRHSGKSPKDNDLEILDAFTSFTCQNDKKSDEFYLNVFGEHNALNATASVIAAMETGLSLEQIKNSLLKFTGSKRRSEYIGQLLSGARVFDDYAHHPTEIKATLSAFRKRFPNLKIVCIFQPHTYSRTKSLFEQFVRSFNDADTVIITNIYASLREKKDPRFSSKQLADAMRVSPRRSHGFQPATSEVARQRPRLLGGERSGNVVFLPKLQDVVEYVDKKKYGNDTIIITMGAGDVYKINEKLQLH